MPNTSAVKKVKIIVADDSPIYHKLVDQALEEQKYEIHWAKNGTEAIALFLKQRPSIVITDWEMPDVTGIDLCAEIRRHQESFTYIIMLTSNTKKEQVIEGLSAGADDYLTKPFHPGELLARVAVGCRFAALYDEIAAKNQLLQELSRTDSLTGLPNRRAIEDWASRQLSGAARHSFPVWVAIADLDHFKKVNDVYGHQAGDLVLKAVAEIIKANTRSSNMCARIGGEEFVVFLSQVDQHGAFIAVERIRHQLECKKFEIGGTTLH